MTSNKRNLRVLIVIIIFMTCFPIALTSDRESGLRKEIITEKTLSADEEWNLFTEAIIWKESRGDENAVGDNGKAVGVLQIWPIMVEEANRICKLRKIDKRYTCEDRKSREKSIEIFNIVQGYHNKKKDFKMALDIWNKNHPESYSSLIMNKFNELKEIALS